MKHASAFFLGFLCIALLAPASVSAFGISPPFVNASRLLKGSRYEATIFLVQGAPDVDLTMGAVFDVPEKIKDWVSIDKGNEFVIPKGTQQFPIKVIVDVPKDAELGVYNGYLRLNTVPVRAEGQQIAISVGGRIDLNLSVGEGVVQEFTVRKIKILDVREGDKPQIVVTIDNTGNVPVTIDRATFDLLDKYGQVRLGYGQIEGDFDEVEPFTISDILIEFPIDVKLAIGEYWGEARVFRGQNVVNELKTVFNVTERKVDYLLYGSILVGAIILGIGFSLVRKRSKRHA
jgi:hypothetical protein